MPRPRDFIAGRWRAVSVLGVTQILCWGTLFYTPVLIVPLIAAERDWPLALTMGGFSVGLLTAALVAPRTGHLIDRFGGEWVMPLGSLLGALGLVLLTLAAHPIAYVLVWVLLGVAMAASLYDAAFATLGRIFGAYARRPITILTLAGGFASTVSWPATHLLIEAVGWRGTYFVYAALLACVATPLHALALPREKAGTPVAPLLTEPAPARVVASKGAAFVLVAAAFAAYAFVPSGLAAHLLAIFGRYGIDSGTVVAIGALFGPSQVGARLIELMFARNLHPLWVARGATALLVMAFALLAVFGISVTTAIAFSVLFGAGNGLLTIARGALPLVLFGPIGFGRLIGRLAAPFLFMQSVAPFVLAFVVERWSDPAALALTAVFAVVALGCFAAVRRPAG